MSTTSPPPDSFSCDVEPNRDCVHVVPRGELDFETVTVVEERLDELLDAGFREVVLDLRRLTFMDSTGLHLIIRTVGRADGDGTRFVLIPGPPTIQRLFDLTGMRDRLTFRDGPLTDGARRE